LALKHQELNIGENEYDLFMNSLTNTLKHIINQYKSTYGLAWRIILF